MDKVKNEKLSLEMGKNGKIVADRKYNWENQAKKVVGLYNKISSKLS